ncbi:MAG: hypothetical protein JNM17_30935 [Archangium sp.]|nr:hypothetical protein [Archangium sp.]
MGISQLDEATWFPKARREVIGRVFNDAPKSLQDLLPFALATKSDAAVEFWRELAVQWLRRDTSGSMTRPVLEHLITLAGKKTLKPAQLRGAIEMFLVSANGPASSADAREALFALGNEVSLAQAHGIYISAARKAAKVSLPKTPPHLDGPIPALTVFETAELTIELAEIALEKKPDAEGKKLVALARKQVAWRRDEKRKLPPPADTRTSVPPTSKAKGPGFALARAALMEACNIDHVSGRGTSIKSGVQHGLSLGESWWLEVVDEALMRADARAAFEKRNQKTSKPIEHVVWRGGDKANALWLVRLAATPKRYALLVKLGRNWSTQEGDLESIAATIPEMWFAKAMPIIEKRR